MYVYLFHIFYVPNTQIWNILKIQSSLDTTDLDTADISYNGWLLQEQISCHSFSVISSLDITDLDTADFWYNGCHSQVPSHVKTYSSSLFTTDIILFCFCSHFANVILLTFSCYCLLFSFHISSNHPRQYHFLAKNCRMHLIFSYHWFSSFSCSVRAHSNVCEYFSALFGVYWCSLFAFINFHLQINQLHLFPFIVSLVSGSMEEWMERNDVSSLHLKRKWSFLINTIIRRALQTERQGHKQITLEQFISCFKANLMEKEISKVKKDERVEI